MNNQQDWQQQVWQQEPPTQPQQPPYAYTTSQQGYYVDKPKGGKGWIVGLAVVVALFLLMTIGVVSCANMFSSSIGSSSSSSSDISFLSRDSIAIIDIDGTIQYDGSNSSPEGLKEQLDKVQDSPYVKAVVLRVNSGGGVATAGEEMSQYVKDFSKPVVVSSASMNASAAYEISSQADYIYTAKTTAIGSIGTAMSITDLSGLYEKLGIRIDDITSSNSKDSSYGNRPLTEEERAYYQQMVDDINETFIETVAEGRHMGTDEVRALATGLTFTGMTAVDNGLADEIGTLEDACDKAAELAGISSYETVNLYQSSSASLMELLDILGSTSSKEELNAYLKELENDGSFSN